LQQIKNEILLSSSNLYFYSFYITVCELDVETYYKQ